MKRRILSLLLLYILSSISLSAQRFPMVQGIELDTDSLFSLPKRPWRAIGKTIGVNLAVWGFDHFIMNEDFADISWQTIKSNFQTGFGWDNDKFVTNLFAHPYHGSLYFNAARSNGLSFRHSAPFAFFGSLMWELLMENEPPSINDLCATTIGGIALGEMGHRLSDLLIDNRTTGWERTGRQVAIALINPMRFLNRLTAGEVTSVASRSGQIFQSVPINIVVDAGFRFLADKRHARTGATALTLNLRFDYGDPFRSETFSPYDFFQFKAGLSFSESQPLLSQINLIGILSGCQLLAHERTVLVGGLFQHFDYYNSEKRISKNSEEVLVTPYRISQVAALGGGLIFQHHGKFRRRPLELYAETYLNVVPMGASLSDHYNVDNRDYNLGSGLSGKLYLGATYNDLWSWLLGVESYRLYTWIGYEEPHQKNTDVSSFMVQGDESKARLLVTSSEFAFHPGPWHVAIVARRFIRKTAYQFYPNVSFDTGDIQLRVGFHF